MKSTLTKFVLGGVAASMLTLGVSADTLTRQNGAPVGDNQNSQTAGPWGPVLLQDSHLIEKLAAFDRERIPERVVQAYMGIMKTWSTFQMKHWLRRFNQRVKRPTFLFVFHR